ncbi:MAG: c-type cytochrome [Planctomycetes bacterium]|nr:c-type cytochrome [Planctomycetota bacterium]
MRRLLTRMLALSLLMPAAFFTLPLPGQKTKPIPHGQDRPPNEPLSPAEAIQRMEVPPGFRVELVAAEPDLVNPVAMTFDERGRIWVAESLEYPRRSAGPGRDRIKVLEDTDGDGKVDKVTIFAEGLNIPSGIAVGHGGVWVANSPDILFYKIGPDGKAAGKPEVVVTGFGRTDTHELPNSLTWGPDGWLYGLNGVFNHSHVKHKGKDYIFTCALFRIHPKTRDFEVFCEGTSNPWGIALDNEGSAFVSACVIDHLWHLTETGYYHRQGGPYPAYTWRLGSIVKHRHQKAAYCGLHFFDSDAYPPEYREKLYMGNIHGGCINADVLERDGATYFARPRPDFLTANDAWFMPVVQKTGPDGCLYILDWYDRYHCYQDANRDPGGIDRLRGRLYRVRYKDTPRAGRFDLAKESDDKLIERLHSPNVYFRDLAQRLLCERDRESTRPKLQKLVLDADAARKARLHALWALVGTGRLEPDFHKKLLAHKDATFRAWGVRAAGNFHQVDEGVRDRVAAMAGDASPDVRLQVAIAARKVEGLDVLPLLVRVLSAAGDDHLIPPIVWQNLHPLLEEHGAAFRALVEKADLKKAPQVAAILPRSVERLLGAGKGAGTAVALVRVLAGSKDVDASVTRQCLSMLAGKVQTGEIAGAKLRAVREELLPLLHDQLVKKGPLYLDAALLATTLRDPAGIDEVRSAFRSADQPEPTRLQALEALIVGGDPKVLAMAADVLVDRKANPANLRGQVLSALGRLENPRVAEVVLARYEKLEPELQPRAIELLTQRTLWGRQLLQAIGKKQVPASALNVNQVRRMLASKDAELTKQVKAHWGTLRTERNPERERIVERMKQFLRESRGDARAGVPVFNKVCAQCHKMYGEGQEVGPDITVNGRASFDQLLSNVFDPSLVIGAAYQATTVVTKKGQVLTGLLVEDNAERVVLKMQGGKLETIPRRSIEDVEVSKLSMMPEDLEKQLKPQEIADLFAYLTLDRPPTDPAAKKIPGAPSFPQRGER